MFGKFGRVHPISQLLFADDKGLRIQAGKVVSALLDDRASFLTRRVETISLTNRNVNERAVSVHINGAEAHRRAASLHVRLDVFPLALLPKSLWYQIDLWDPADSPVPIVSRELDARMAQSHLVAMACVHYGLAVPNEAVWDCLYQCTYRFPEAGAPVGSFAARALELGRTLEGADARWWRSACSNGDWARWLIRYVENYLLVPDLALPPESVVLEYRYAEAKEIVGPKATQVGLLNRRRPVALAQPSRRLAFRLNDLGRAHSEHVRIVAPDGTFLADGVVARRGSLEQFEYRDRLARSQMAFYFTRVRARNATLQATLWPDPRGFLTPLRILVCYSLFLNLAVLLLTIRFSLHSIFDGSVDAAVSVAFFGPALLLTYLLRPDEPEIRWGLLSGSRTIGITSLGLLLFGWFGVLTGVQHVHQGPLVALFAGLLTCQFGLAALVERQRNRLRIANDVMRAHELRPRKGRRVTVRLTRRDTAS